MIDILLATYNGEKYLAELLESIRAQDCAGWRVLLADDGSSDGTIDVIRDFSRQLGDRLVFCETDSGRSGSRQVFSALLARSTARYLMFCDQDDVWHVDKISRTLQAMRAAEARYGADTPLLVHTDLAIVDCNLRMLAPSFRRYQHLSPELGGRLNRLLTQNVVTGCTVMINRPLAVLAEPISSEATMHDWWLALVANLFGRVVYLDEATISYRQHGDNVIGARRWGGRRILQQARSPREIRSSMLQSMRQARALLERYRERMAPGQSTMVEAYAHLPLASPVGRMAAVLRYRLLKHGLVRNLGFLSNLCLLDRARR